jgi:hypothetical protein
VIGPSGEVVGEFETVVQELNDVIAGLTRDVKAEHLRFENLKRDKAAEARRHPLFEAVRDLFYEWRAATGHPRSAFTADRFWAALPFLENEAYGEDMIRRAIAGAAFDPYSTTRKNGSTKRYDSWSGYPSSIFASADKFEDFCNRAPIPKDGDPAAGSTTKSEPRQGGASRLARRPASGAGDQGGVGGRAGGEATGGDARAVDAAMGADSYSPTLFPRRDSDGDAGRTTDRSATGHADSRSRTS